MTDKWQCCICKQTKVVSIKTISKDITQTNGNILNKVVIDPDDIPIIKCHFRKMRNLTEAQYINESSINDSGKRG